DSDDRGMLVARPFPDKIDLVVDHRRWGAGLGLERKHRRDSAAGAEGDVEAAVCIVASRCDDGATRARCGAEDKDLVVRNERDRVRAVCERRTTEIGRDDAGISEPRVVPAARGVARDEELPALSPAK